MQCEWQDKLHFTGHGGFRNPWPSTILCRFRRQTAQVLEDYQAPPLSLGLEDDILALLCQEVGFDVFQHGLVGMRIEEVAQMQVDIFEAMQGRTSFQTAVALVVLDVGTYGPSQGIDHHTFLVRVHG